MQRRHVCVHPGAAACLVLWKVHGPERRRKQLRRLRQRVRGEPAMHGRKVHLPAGSVGVRPRVRRFADGQFQLRSLRRPVHRGHYLPGGLVPVRQRRHAMRRAMYAHPKRPEQLRCMRQRMRRGLGLRQGHVRTLVQFGRRGRTHQLQWFVRRLDR